jgi:thiamine biosynthesis lipoprotein
MSLTLDGIAKGAVIDAAVESLRSDGFLNVIVEAGGDLMASGEHALSIPWKIGLRAPRNNAGLDMPVLMVRNMAVATSGDYLQPLTEDGSIHHILDPRKGVSSPELASVTIVAPTAVLADALATAIMVSGSAQGLKLLQDFPDCDVYMVTRDLQCISTPGMEQYVA